MAEKPITSETSLYLCAPINALVEGIYEERIPFSEIKKHGDFGLGTFNHLDGEMVLLDNIVYQTDSKGRVTIIGDDALTPFSCVTFYKPMCFDDISEEIDYARFSELLNSLYPSTNLFYAIRIDGIFSYVKTRSVPRQSNYRPLVEVAKEQSVFEYRDVEGVLAGFYTPSFMSSLNAPGPHLHFLSSDRACGGHLLECRPKKARIGIQFLYKLELSLPRSFDYLTLDFQRDINKDLHKAEK